MAYIGSSPIAGSSFGGTTADLLGVEGVTIMLVYRTANSRWELPDGTVPTLTGRTARILWQGTTAQIPAQGTGGSDFQEGDLALVRSETL